MAMQPVPPRSLYFLLVCFAHCLILAILSFLLLEATKRYSRDHHCPLSQQPPLVSVGALWSPSGSHLHEEDLHQTHVHFSPIAKAD